MAKSKKEVTYPPLIYNVFKPANVTSYDVIRHFKRHLPDGFGKIGHFGTLDPFACGVQLIAVAGAARLNDLVHEFLPKTYLAIGKLGVETETGDMTVEAKQVDESDYLNKTISKFEKEFIEEKLKENFLGDYLQAPHKYSASKYEGKALHEWARAGVEIQKEKKLRHIYHVEVVKYEFPYLSVRVTVSSGTFVRTIFSDFANYLGTIGSLVSLVRESIGELSTKDSLLKKNWPKDKEEYSFTNGKIITDVLPFSMISFAPFEAKLFRNGVPLEFSRTKDLFRGRLEADYYWVKEDEKIISLAKLENDILKPYINFS